MNVDLYFILNLTDIQASKREIKQAYVKLARQLHPDKNFGKSSDRFLLVQVAYEVLGDPIKRRLYDIGRERRSGSFASNSSSSSFTSTPTRRKDRTRTRRPPPESYDWTKDISEASRQREADIQRFNLWKEALFQDLDEIDKSLRSMAPSPQKVDLLRTMIHRVDQIRATTKSTNMSISKTQGKDDVQKRTLRMSNSFNNGDEKDAKRDVLLLEAATGPSDDFLAFLNAKKKKQKTAASKK